MIAIFEDFYEGQYFPDKALPPKRIRTVLDIGAHIGTFSLLVHLLHKKATIYAYEPIRENFALLEKNIRANNTKRLFHLYHQAVWKNDNNQKIYFDGNSFLGSSLSNKKSSSHYEVVSCVTLQQIFKKERIPMCDLVKIDVEGAEYEILYTTPKSILARMKAIYVEFHGTIDDIAHKRKTLIDFFHKQGYFVYQYTKRDILYAVRQKSTIKVSPLLTACQ